MTFNFIFEITEGYCKLAFSQDPSLPLSLLLEQRIPGLGVPIVSKVIFFQYRDCEKLPLS